MRPLRFLIGFILVAYLVSSYFSDTLRYSVYADLGNLYWDISNPIGSWLKIPQYFTHSQLMAFIYAIVIFAGIVMMLSGLGGKHDA